ncbi:MAG: ribonuclease HII [Deinococcus sp.]|nr:ribonuclease HII [Deinococcus sp.]
MEQAAQATGASRIAGIDEAGRGALAGPVVAAAVILSPRGRPPWRDSKQLDPQRRSELFQLLKESALIGIGSATAQEIDQLNILQATILAATRAVAALAEPPDYLITDVLRLPLPLPQNPVVRGDQRSYSVAAASIVAKVTRDRLMLEVDQRYPGYGFAAHKGYGTPEHLAALGRLGPCVEHRRSFRPVVQAGLF